MIITPAGSPPSPSNTQLNNTQLNNTQLNNTSTALHPKPKTALDVLLHHV
jgi:hypothetical protein